MKKIVLVLISVLLLAGCGVNDSDNAVGAVEESQIQEAVADMAAMEEELLDLENYSVENDTAICGQPEFLWNSAAGSDLGIYYWGGASNSMEKLMFYDKAAKVGVYLCNRPNCEHDDDNCNASFHAYRADGIQFYRNMLFYYENSVFLVGDDEESAVNLYKVARDGSSWEKYMTLFKADKTVVTDGEGTGVSWRYPDVCLHQDYVYFIDNSESAPKLRRIQMGGSKTEVVVDAEAVFDAKDERTMLYRMKAYGDFVFFQAGKYVGEELQAGIYAYNTKNGGITLVKAKALRGYYVVNEMLYYESNEKIYKYDLKTGEDMELPVTGPSDVSVTFFADENGMYLFHSDTGKLDMYNENGSLLGSVSDSGVVACHFGKDGIFYGNVSGSSQSAILEVEDVLNGNGKWIYIQ